MVFDQRGEVKAFDYLEHRQILPRPGWVEHDPMEIWENTCRVMRRALAGGGIAAADIAGIGVTNQRETTLVWEKRSGRPFHNAIVWQDTRTSETCRELTERGLTELVERRTGLKIATYFSGPKIKWILDNVDGVRQAARAGEALFGNIDSWLIWWLTGGPEGGVHLTDCSNASRTMLMDLEKHEWDTELLGILDIPSSMLPAIRSSIDPDFYGRTAASSPIGEGVAVCADLGDQQAALFGQCCYSAGEAKNTYGTGNFLLLNTGSRPVRSPGGLITTLAGCHPGGTPAYALEGSVAVSGAALQWLRDSLQMIKNSSETEAIAASVEDTGGVYFVPAFSGLFAPYWDMGARGILAGLSRNTTRPHLVRACLEAICYQTRQVLEAMESDSGYRLESLRVDGGAARNNFLMQLQADILGVEVVRPAVQETTALGAAYAAGLACGLWRDQEELRQNWRMERTFTPHITEQRRQEGYAGWREAVQRSRNWVNA